VWTPALSPRLHGEGGKFRLALPMAMSGEVVLGETFSHPRLSPQAARYRGPPLANRPAPQGGSPRGLNVRTPDMEKRSQHGGVWGVNNKKRTPIGPHLPTRKSQAFQ
jgi:hypothetical protein